MSAAEELLEEAEPLPTAKPRTITQRRWANFCANRRAFWSLWIFALLFGLSLFAEFLANDKPIIASYQGEWRMPILTFYSEEDYGGEFRTEAEYADEVVVCLIKTGGIEDCLDDPEAVIEEAASGVYNDQPVEAGWILWPPIRYNFRTIDENLGRPAPAPPSSRHLLGTDDQARDVLARVIYGFRISILFA
ncbi:MAG: ABC transporter permease, partial [Pseudomonadota bacterium]